MRRRRVLLRIANVNPDSVTTHSDRVLYSSIGVFIVLYFAYATVGGAAFVDASANYTHPWYQWLVGPLVATGVVAYDRAVVGRVAINYERLDSPDPEDLLRKPTFGLYAGRLALALLFAVIITEPLMLSRYQGEIDARLNEVHNEQISKVEVSGAIAAYDARLRDLKKQTVAENRAVQALNTRAAEKRRDARKLYDQAIADSEGNGVTRRSGCPDGGYCDTLVQRSRGLDDQAARLDAQAARLQDTQKAARTARAAEEADLTTKIADQRTVNAESIRADAGFGARTKAMWYLVNSDFWGIGVFYLGVALLLVALDCAAVGLKFVSHGNAYERTEAREARVHEHEAAIGYEQGLKDVRRYAEATSRVMAEGIGKASRDEQIADVAIERARAHLYDSVAGSALPPLPPIPLIERHPAAPRTQRNVDSLRA
ncbi:DUF4407 domain-containing protein [Actinoplanes friuliensis]|uniref:DUF4407 domain-containing protein n=1 Tax=Actinoplanes friuliensis TaxID=196914 RepID=UPI00042A62D9|nr:DUF4407 domain-containing protein [Actinoplanes friuliensis]